MTLTNAIFRQVLSIGQLFNNAVCSVLGSKYTYSPIYIALQVYYQLMVLKHTYTADPQHRKLSPQYRAVESLFRSLPPRKLNIDNDVIAEAEVVQKGAGNMKQIFPQSRSRITTSRSYHHIPKPVAGVTFPARDVKVYTIRADKSVPAADDKQSKVIVYLHGGSYIHGDCAGYSAFHCELSQRAKLPVMHVEYSLAPQTPLPQIVAETVDVWSQMVEEDSSLPSRSILMGDSAGGGLSLLVIQHLLKRKLPVPHQCVCLSPYGDISQGEHTGKEKSSWVLNKSKDAMLGKGSKQTNTWYREAVLGGRKHIDKVNSKPIDFADPQYSPSFGDFTNFPALLLTAGTAEQLESDSRIAYERAKQAGADVELQITEHMMHVFQLFYHLSPEASKGMDDVVHWIRRHQ